MSFLSEGRVHVKVCGVTNPGDAAACVSAGVDAIGFNFFSGSPRCVDLAVARSWIRDLEGSACRVAVVVDPSPQLLDRLREAECFELIQFHGDETPAFCEGAGFPDWIKALRVPESGVPEEAQAFSTPNLLLDGWSPVAYGGTGKRLDWDMARDYVDAHPERRIILAGGLNPHNVAQAARLVRPRAVDVASGVELSPGHKEEYLVREFVNAVRHLPSVERCDHTR